MKPTSIIGPLIGLFFAIVGSVAPSLAQANPSCGPRAQVIAPLTGERYQEAPVFQAITANGALLEVFANADRSTWSIVVNIPGGPSCLVATGEHWQAINPAEAGVVL